MYNFILSKKILIKQNYNIYSIKQKSSNNEVFKNKLSVL